MWQLHEGVERKEGRDDSEQHSVVIKRWDLRWSLTETNTFHVADGLSWLKICNYLKHKLRFGWVWRNFLLSFEFESDFFSVSKPEGERQKNWKGADWSAVSVRTTQVVQSLKIVNIYIYRNFAAASGLLPFGIGYTQPQFHSSAIASSASNFSNVVSDPKFNPPKIESAS